MIFDFDVFQFSNYRRINKMPDEIIEINEDGKVTIVEEVIDMDAVNEQEASDSEVKTEPTV